MGLRISEEGSNSVAKRHGLLSAIALLVPVLRRKTWITVQLKEVIQLKLFSE